MTLTSPKTIEQFANVFGVGATKQKQYGQIFIDVIKKYEGTNGQG